MTAPAPIVPLRPQLEGTCATAGCREQHLHPLLGVPPDYHYVVNGKPEPRWREARRAGNDPSEWWYRIEEVARTAGVSWQTVRRWIRRGALRATLPPGGRIWLIKGADLDEFLRESKRPYPKEK